MTVGPAHHGTATHSDLTRSHERPGPWPVTLAAKTRRTRLVSALAVVAAATMFATFPAQAAPDSLTALPTAVEKVAYAALGDSYAAGFGGGDYDPNDLCVQSPNGYAALLASDPGQVHVALRGCTGADTADVLGQLDGLAKKTKFVTLTVGANDLGLDAVIRECLPGASAACDEAIANALSSAQNTLPNSLGETFAAVRTAAPKAHVVVTGYPRLLDPLVPTSGPINAGVDLLNDVIAGVVAAAGPGFTYLDVTGEFTDHGIGSIDPWLVGPPALDAFHPNEVGYAVYADAIRAVR
ncbi:MAG: SGNH/GDSL hydrolase family protein [Dermatophilaceae bacterium]